MPPGGVSRVTVALATYQNEDAGPYGKERQDNAQAAHRHERGQACENEPNGQQDKAYISVHRSLLMSNYLVI
jgi:hypothetical protein